MSPSPDGALSACAALRHPAPPRRRPPPRRLLLEELLAHTEPGHPDEADLREALARIREVPPSHSPTGGDAASHTPSSLRSEPRRAGGRLHQRGDARVGHALQAARGRAALRAAGGSGRRDQGGGGALLQHTRALTRPDGCAAQVLEKSLVRQGRAFVREGELTKVRLAHRQRRKAVLSSASRARLPLRHASAGRVLDVSSLGLPLLRPARVRRAHRARLRPKGPDPPRRGDAGERERVAAHTAPGAQTRPRRAAPHLAPPSHVP